MDTELAFIRRGEQIGMTALFMDPRSMSSTIATTTAEPASTAQAKSKAGSSL
jgi:hypothetical protein